MAVGAYTTALFQKMFSDHDVTTQWTLVYSLLAAVVVSGLAGLVIGLAAARLRGPYLAGLTLAIVLVVPAITTHWSASSAPTRVSPVPMNPPPAMLGDGFPNEQWQAYFAVIAAAMTMFLLANLVRSRVGRTFRAVRDNEVAAQLAGIHVARTQVIAFVVSAACAGLGGGVVAAINQAVSPDSYSLTLSLYLLLAIVLGGVGSLAGAVWGSAAIVVLPYLTAKLMTQHDAVAGGCGEAQGQRPARGLRPGADRHRDRRARRHPGTAAPDRTDPAAGRPRSAVAPAPTQPSPRMQPPSSTEPGAPGSTSDTATSSEAASTP